MAGPTLVAVDEDPELLGDVERELRDRYARHYDVVCLQDPEEALTRLGQLAAEGEEVALILTSQLDSGMTAGELMDGARRLHPDSKRGLMIAWGEWGQRATGEAIFERDRPRTDRPLPAQAGDVA